MSDMLEKMGEEFKAKNPYRMLSRREYKQILREKFGIK